jgi:hypothetical protein
VAPSHALAFRVHWGAGQANQLKSKEISIKMMILKDLKSRFRCLNHALLRLNRSKP